MTLATAIVTTVVVLFLSALFSGSEIAYVQSSKVRMEIDAAGGGIAHRIIRIFSRHENMFISTMLVGNNIVLVIYGITFSIIINPILEGWFSNEALVLIVNTIISTGIVLIAGEFIPKTIFRINPNFMMRLLAIPLFLVYWTLYPVSLLVSGISKGLMWILGIKSDNDADAKLSIEELDDYLQDQLDNVADKTMVENEVKIFRNAIDFKDTQVGDCMIPRNEIIAVELDSTTREQLIDKFITTGLSKIVVYKEDIDDIVGYIHVAELFDVNADWHKLIRKVIFTPEAMLANKMMRRMLAEKRSLAVVVDEFGGTAGLLTLEDIVEEIFGEIEDEHDHQQTLVKELGTGVYEVSGRAEISNLNNELGLDISEDEDYQTLAGFLLDILGRFPAQGETLEANGFEFTILKMSANRIDLVKITKI